MRTEIRPARKGDLGRVCELYQQARRFMRAHGNTMQWTGDYPGMASAEADLEAGALWVLEAGGEPVAVASVMPGPEPTYASIDGAWVDDGPYWVLHRLASGESGKGYGRRLMEWFGSGHRSCRVDTANQNLPMRGLVESCGFVRCGIVIVEDGTPRIAYQRVNRGLDD
ncbi:MAG: GNAT family N-acetyltransferase [Tractidigestivibacter sp.]|uniref:GNAT family N-acetyltransferase n=1 Tax=Tractidigestivibacter sp. TaxID=2847320 RepID=UPI003D90903C